MFVLKWCTASMEISIKAIFPFFSNVGVTLVKVIQFQVEKNDN